ncbi:MAG: hypothetical protein JST31_06370 [Actinobacteria bacterium]|nr:hypothetical protein [Actinomycetota bacterium]
MVFDQYHEPPEGLPARTRTFARLCASLDEESQAIGVANGEAAEAGSENLALVAVGDGSLGIGGLREEAR